MDDTRIKDISGYKGYTRGFLNLYDAMWSKAVEDEMRSQKCRLLVELSEKIYPVLLKYNREDRRSYARIQTIIGERYGKPGLEVVMALEAEIEKNTPALVKLVQLKVYAETGKWPNNSKKADSEFDKQYRQLRDNILKSLDSRGTKEA